MCGIVGMIGTGLAAQDKKMFRELLIIDTIRGADSTGYIAVEDGIVSGHKKAVDGYTFTSLKAVDKRIGALGKGLSCLVGHNRAATKGAVTDDNAHPFKCGGTHLVHNGSLITWSGLHNATNTSVDSEAVCFNVEEFGLKATVEKLDGAFALVVYDEKSGIISFVRNDERPLWFAETTVYDQIIFASEPKMIELVANKNKVKLASKPWELKTNCIMSFNLKAKSVVDSRQLEEDIEFLAKTLDWWDEYNYGGYNYSSGGYGRTSTNLVPFTPSKNSPTLPDMNLKYDQHGIFLPYKIEMFGASSVRGVVIGDLYSCTTPSYKIGDGAVYSMTLDSFDKIKGELFFCKIKGITKATESKVATPTVQTEGKLTEDEYDNFWDSVDVDYTYEESLFLLKDGEYLDFNGDCITKKEFTILVKDGCSYCGNPIEITPKESLEMEWVFTQDEPLCSSCTEMHSSNSKITGTTIEESILGGLI